MNNTCSKHPKYKVKRSPRSGCLECWRIYQETHPDRIKAQFPPIQLTSVMARPLIYDPEHYLEDGSN